jgi:hypothetical protein
MPRPETHPDDHGRCAFVPHRTAREDPAEAREHRLLLDALLDRLGPRLEVRTHPEAGYSAVFGRTDPARRRAVDPGLRYPRPDQCDFPYWEEPGFLAAAGRSVRVCDLAEARQAVAALHAQGRDAFVKATQTKLFALPVPIGTRLGSALGDLAYSVCDAGQCLLVQERIPLRDEYRVFVVDGTPVTGAGKVDDRTPADNIVRFDPAFQGQGDVPVRLDPDLAERYRQFALAFTKGTRRRDYTLDLAVSGPRIVCVEMNPLYLGRVGLFACDLDALVDAVLASAGISTVRSAREGAGTREALAV